MRQIKFRGKSPNGTWIFGYFVGQTNEGPHIVMNIEDPTFEHESVVDGVKVDPETVGQFTGLYDKGGKEIFEGDIVMARITIEVNEGDDFDYYVTYDDDDRRRISCSLKPSVVEYTERGYIFRHRSGKYTPFWVCAKDIKEKYEVVGNKFDNPELL